MNDLDRMLEEQPVRTRWFLYAATRFKNVHYRLPRDSPFRGWNTLDAAFTRISGERLRFPPYIVDAIAMLALLPFAHHLVPLCDGPMGWAKAAGIALSLLGVRVVLFATETFLFILCHEMPFLDRRYHPVYYFPGIVFRTSYVLGVVLPQALVLGIWFGGCVGAVVLAVGLVHFAFRWFEGDGLYLSSLKLLGPFDFLMLIGLAMGVGVAWWSHT